jgi:PAS domain S-box-containing protein
MVSSGPGTDAALLDDLVAENERLRRELQRTTEELAQATRYKTHFLVNVSHELRTPLHSLLILAQQLANNPEGNLSPRQVEFAQTIRSAGEDLLTLINDVLDLSKVESGTTTVSVGPVPLAGLGMDMERTFGELAHQKDLAFSVELADDLPESITTDGVRLRQVLKNLLANAFKFTDQGWVRLRIRPAAGGWRPDHELLNRAPGAIAFEVADTGIGIPRDKRELIFEAFQQADAETSRRYGGTGLGLSISREIATLLGGDITVEGEVGVGSVFTLFLPRVYERPTPAPAVAPPPAEAPAARAPAAAAPVAAPDRVDILLVDDDPHNLVALDAILEAPNRRLVHATSGDEALRCLEQDDFAVILLDVQLPGLDGFETAARIRDRSRTTPIIFLTAAITSDQRLRGYELGAVDYITKPFDPAALRAKVAVFVELFRKTRELAATTEFLNSILEGSTGFAIMALDLDARILAWNTGARLMYGYAPEEVVGVGSLEQLHTPEDVASGRVRAFVERALATGRVEEVFEQVRASGERFQAALVLHHRRDAAGTPIGFVAIVQDVTERLRAEQERARLIEEQAARAEAEAGRRRIEEINTVLRDTVDARDAALSRVESAMKTRDEFLAAASHDLRTPLTVIRAQAQLLARRTTRAGGPDAADTLAALAKINLSTRKMARLVDQMLDVAQLQVGHPLQLDRRPTDLVQVAAEVVQELAEAQPKRRIRLDAAEPSLVGEWDAARIERAIENLLTNALKYSPDDSEVVVSLGRATRAGRPWATLAVQDHGVGIPADELPRIFERFFRGRNVVGKVDGTGIGLAGVRQIVEQHGGTVQVDSTEGVGTTVTLELPLLTAECPSRQ